MKNVYLVKKNGGVIAHTDLQAMKELEGVEKPDMTITLAEYEAAGGLVRLIGNKIVVGKTPAEKAEDEKQAEISALKAELAEIDREAGAGRAVRGLALEQAKKEGIRYDTGNKDFDNLQNWENRADPLRKRPLRKRLDKLK